MHVTGVEVNLTNVTLYYVPLSIGKVIIYIGAIGFYTSGNNRMSVGRSDIHHIWAHKPPHFPNMGISMIVCPYVVCLEI